MYTTTYSICKAVIFYADNCVISESYESYKWESLTHRHYNPELGESHRSQMAVFVYDSSSCSIYQTNAYMHASLRKCLSV